MDIRFIGRREAQQRIRLASRPAATITIPSGSLRFASSSDTDSVGSLSLPADSTIRRHIFNNQDLQPFDIAAKKSFLYKLGAHSSNVADAYRQQPGGFNPPFPVKLLCQAIDWLPQFANPIAHLSAFAPGSKRLGVRLERDKLLRSHLYSQVYPYAALMRGDVKSTLESFKTALEANSYRPRTYFELGNLAYKLMQYQKQLQSNDIPTDGQEPLKHGFLLSGRRDLDLLSPAASLERKLAHHLFELDQDVRISTPKSSFSYHIPIPKTVFQVKASMDLVKLRQAVLSSSIPFEAIALEAYQRTARMTSISEKDNTLSKQSDGLFQKVFAQMRVHELSGQPDKAIALAESFIQGEVSPHKGRDKSDALIMKYLLSQMYSANRTHDKAISLAVQIIADPESSLTFMHARRKLSDNLMTICKNAVSDGFQSQADFRMLVLPYLKPYLKLDSE